MLFNNPRITAAADRLVAALESGQKLDQEQIEFLETYALDRALDVVLSGGDMAKLVSRVDAARKERSHAR